MLTVIIQLINGSHRERGFIWRVFYFLLEISFPASLSSRTAAFCAEYVRFCSCGGGVLQREKG